MTIKILFILSVSLNIAFSIHLFTSSADSQADPYALNLSEVQKESAARIRMQNHRANEKLKKEIAMCQEELMALLKAEEVDKEKINGCLEKISSLQRDIQKNTIAEILQLKNVLDTHQCNCLIDGLHSKLQGASAPCTGACCNPQAK
jgi:Spy/CpxP family protein refolding chaperone